MSKAEEPVVTPERITELKLMARGLYGTIIGLTDTPFEAVTIVEMLHLTIWMNNSQPGFDPKLMLEDYNKSFLENLEANEAHEKGKLQ